MLNPLPYARKPFLIEAVQATFANMDEVAEWCGGTLQSDDQGRPYIKVDVRRAAYVKQTMAYEGDWVLKAGTGFRVYTDNAFHKSFEPTGPTMPDSDNPCQSTFDRPGIDRKVVEPSYTSPDPVRREIDDNLQRLVTDIGERVFQEAQDLANPNRVTRMPSGTFRTPAEIRKAYNTKQINEGENID